MTKILGHRPNQAEREDFRNAVSRRGEIRSNRPSGEPTNTYATLLATENLDSRDPRDQARISRLRAKSAEWEANHTVQRERELIRLRMSERDEVQAMQSHFAQVINTCKVRSPQDTVDRSQCLEAINKALSGDESAIDEYYARATDMVQRRLEESDAALQEVRTRASDANIEHARVETEHARLAEVTAQANLNQARSQ
jgi:hypothetical protein